MISIGIYAAFYRTAWFKVCLLDEDELVVTLKGRLVCREKALRRNLINIALILLCSFTFKLFAVKENAIEQFLTGGCSDSS